MLENSFACEQVTSEWVEGGVIAFIIIFNTLLGFSQEYSSERTLAALQKLGAATATVLRNGESVEIDKALVVPGDIVLLSAGSHVPADLRLISCSSLDIDEAVLTGESMPVRKNSDPLDDAESPLGDRINMAYSGCSVQRGRGRGVVTVIGMNTELGKIASAVSAKSDSKSISHMQREVRRLSIILFAIGLVFGFVVFGTRFCFLLMGGRFSCGSCGVYCSRQQL
jgi:P-type E1-E2 ATPase